MTCKDNNKLQPPSGGRVSRRTIMKTAGVLAAGAGAGVFPGPLIRTAYAGEKPLKIGFQVHRTGIGAVYGRWYERTTTAAVKRINERGGIAGRPVRIIAEDDGTDPKRGPEVVEKLAVQYKCDVVFGTLFSDVVIASAPRAGELKMPYFVVSEGYHVASGRLNRYVFQPGITDVRAQVTAVGQWALDHLGKKVAMIYPDYAFGYNHRDFFGALVKKVGGTMGAAIAIPPTETSFTKYFARIPSDTELLYHVMVGPGVLSFVKEMGEFYGSKRPNIFGFIDSLEGVDMASPGLGFLEGTYFWEAFPRYAMNDKTAAAKAYRKDVGVNADGASIADPKDVSTYSHMFGCWETLYVIKQAIEKSGYREPTASDKKALIETTESFTDFPEGMQHPQGEKKFIGKLHQCYGHQYVSKVKDRKLVVLHRTSIEDSMYPPATDYTTRPL